MWFNFLKKKKEEVYNEYIGRFITEEEIQEMIKPNKKSYIKKEFDDINNMFSELKKSVNYE